MAMFSAVIPRLYTPPMRTAARVSSRIQCSETVTHFTWRLIDELAELAGAERPMIPAALESGHARRAGAERHRDGKKQSEAERPEGRAASGHAAQERSTG